MFTYIEKENLLSPPILQLPPKAVTAASPTRSSLQRNKKFNPMLRQRNIQIQAMNSMDRATDDEDEAIKESFRKRKVNFEERSEDEQLDTDIFETYLVIAFGNNCNNKALHWIVDKIRGKRSHGGAELLIRMEPQSE